ncbi:hypothetical protein [Thalassotalea montiporae]
MRKIAILLSLLLQAVSIGYVMAKDVSLKPGLYEGISEHEFVLLQLNENGNHKIFKMNIPSAFQHGKQRDFSEQNIHCDQLRCLITFDTEGTDYIDYLSLAPEYEDSSNVMVFEQTKSRAGEPMVSRAYQLSYQKNRSTIREYWSKYRETIDKLLALPEQGIYGLWVGTIRKDDKVELLSLAVYPDQPSTLTKFFLGMGITNETSFEPQQLVKENGAYRIQTSHPSFANQLLLVPMYENALNGYAFHTAKTHSWIDGSFQLYRVKEEKR